MATGANEFVPRIPGVDGANVVSVIDAHMNWDLVKGERIVVCGGGLSGCEAAYDLAKEKGMSVTVVEMGDKVLNGVFTINADSLLRKMQGYDITAYLRPRHARHGRGRLHRARWPGGVPALATRWSQPSA